MLTFHPGGKRTLAFFRHRKVCPDSARTQSPQRLTGRTKEILLVGALIYVGLHTAIVQPPLPLSFRFRVGLTDVGLILVACMGETCACKTGIVYWSPSG